jgi:uncharacterized protein
MRSISYPFRLAPGGQVASTTKYEEIVRAHVIDALMTNLGERVMRPNYGCDIQAALFDPSDELVRADAAGQIRTRLQDYAPRCIVRSCRVEVSEAHPFMVYVSIVYKPSLYATDTELTVPVSSEYINRSLAQQAARSPLEVTA